MADVIFSVSTLTFRPL